jgi:anti-anti-sigma regulatory factor
MKPQSPRALARRTILKAQSLRGAAVLEVKSQIRAAITENPYADEIILDLTEVDGCDANGTDLIVSLYSDPFFAGGAMKFSVRCTVALYRKFQRLGLPDVNMASS